MLTENIEKGGRTIPVAERYIRSSATRFSIATAYDDGQQRKGLIVVNGRQYPTFRLFFGLNLPILASTKVAQYNARTRRASRLCKAPLHGCNRGVFFEQDAFSPKPRLAG